MMMSLLVGQRFLALKGLLSTNPARIVTAKCSFSSSDDSKSIETQTSQVDLTKFLDLNALPTRPTRPNPFHAFFDQRYAQLKRSHPDLDRSNALQQIKAEWEQTDRSAFERTQEADLEKYREQLKAYNQLMKSQVTVGQVVQLLQELRKTVRPRITSKRAYTALNVYLQEYATDCKQKNTTFRLAEASESFKRLSESEKQKYQQLAHVRTKERRAAN